MNMEQFKKNNGAAGLTDADMDAISGGVGMSGTDAAKRYRELNELWNAWDFEGHGKSPNLLDSIFEEWEHSGFPGTAKDWLSKYKNW